MPRPFNNEISTQIDMTQAQRRLIFRINELGRVDVMYAIGDKMAKYYNEFVPNKTGELRESVRVYAGPHRMTLSWGNTARTKKYVRYQYGGKVYGPNRPTLLKGSDTFGFRTKRGTKKYDTGRELGVEHDWLFRVRGKKWYLHHFGYTTPNTHHHWITEARRDTTKWRKFRLDLTELLQNKLKEIQ